MSTYFGDNGAVALRADLKNKDFGSNIVQYTTSQTVKEKLDELDSGVVFKSTIDPNNAQDINFIQSGVGAVNRTSLTKMRETVTPQDFGAVGDGVADDTAALQAAVNAHDAVRLDLHYKVTAPILLNDNQTIFGAGKITHPSTLGTDCAFSIISKSGIRIEGITFTGATTSTVANAAIIAVDSSDIEVYKCKTTNIGLIKTRSSATSYAAVDYTGETNICKTIRVSKCNIVGAGMSSQTLSVGIMLSYTKDWVVENCKITNASHGVQWWGGNANHVANGAIANQRKNGDGIVSKCRISGIAGGGIWGSMGEDITVFGNIVKNCNDVGIDPEGCFDFVATGNVVSNCSNGCLTGFFYNINCNFTGNIVTQNGTNGTALFRTYNSAQTEIPTYKVEGNSFRFLGSGVGVIEKQSSKTFTFTDNKLEDCTVSFAINNNGFLSVKKNEMYFTKSITSTKAVYILGNNGLGVTIIDNDIYSAVTNTDALVVEQTNFNTAVISLIKNNNIRGFTNAITLQGQSGNAGIIMQYTVKDNQYNGAYVDLVPAGRANILKVNNYNMSGVAV